MSEAEELLSKHRSVIDKYVRKFQIDLKENTNTEQLPTRGSGSALAVQDLRPEDSLTRLSQISKSFGKYLSNPAEDPAALGEDDVLIGDDFNLTKPEMLGASTQAASPDFPKKTKGATSNGRGKTEAEPPQVFAVDESLDADAILERWKGKTQLSTRLSGSQRLTPRVDLSDSLNIEELKQKYIQAPPKSPIPPETVADRKSDDDLDAFLANLKTRLASTRGSPKEDVHSESRTPRTPRLSPRRSHDPSVPPRMHQSVELAVIHKRVHESRKRRSVDTMQHVLQRYSFPATSLSSKERQPLSKDHLLIDRYVTITSPPLPLVPERPPNAPSSLGSQHTHEHGPALTHEPEHEHSFEPQGQSLPKERLENENENEPEPEPEPQVDARAETTETAEQPPAALQSQQNPAIYAALLFNVGPTL